MKKQPKYSLWECEHQSVWRVNAIKVKDTNLKKHLIMKEIKKEVKKFCEYRAMIYDRKKPNILMRKKIV